MLYVIQEICNNKFAYLVSKQQTKIIFYIVNSIFDTKTVSMND